MVQVSTNFKKSAKILTFMLSIVFTNFTQANSKNLRPVKVYLQKGIQVSLFRLHLETFVWGSHLTIVGYSISVLHNDIVGCNTQLRFRCQVQMIEAVMQ